MRNALYGAKQRQAKYYNQHAKHRSTLNVGQTVRVKLDNLSNDWHKAVISKKLPFRSYEIRLPDGSTRRRTSKHIRISNESPPAIDDDDFPLLPARDAPPPVAPSALASHSADQRTVTTRSGRQVRKPIRYRENS